jgi:hypothetical protein
MTMAHSVFGLEEVDLLQMLLVPDGIKCSHPVGNRLAILFLDGGEIGGRALNFIGHESRVLTLP